MSDNLSLTVGGQVLDGWTEISVTRSMEQVPNSFSLTATDISPVSGKAVMVQEGAPCTVKLGPDTVITGYVDAVVPGYDARSHTVTVQGRGKCQDLADCSAEWKGSQVSATSALDIAGKLAAPYGITARNLGPAGPHIPQFNISIGDTPIDVIEKIAKYSSLVYYEDQDGNLVFDQAGGQAAASGFTEGRNVQSASYMRSMNGRYSDYWASLLSVYTGALFADSPGVFSAKARDPNVARNRKLFSVVEGVAGGQVLAKNKVNWEAARRYGRSRQVIVRCDSWRDSGGTLWTPNTLADVALPRLQLASARLCIATVTFSARLGEGRTAEVTLMPKEAFLPEPIMLQPLLVGVVGPNLIGSNAPLLQAPAALRAR